MSEADHITVGSGEIVTERAQQPASLVQKQSPSSDGNAAAALRMDEIAGINEGTSSASPSNINEPSQPAAPPKKLLATIKIPSMFATSNSSNIAPSIGTENSSTSPEASTDATERPAEPKAASPQQVEPSPEVFSPAAPMMVLPGPSSAPAVPATQAPGPIFPGPLQTPATNQNRPSSGTGAHPQLNDALAYLDRVKAEFQDQPEVYNKFLQIMRDFKVNAIDSNGVIYRLVHLFMGHKSLIEGFNAFLPKTHHIDPMVAETGVLPAHIMTAAIHSGIAAQHPPHPQMLGKMPPGSTVMGQSGQGQTINLSHFVNPSNLPVSATWNVDQQGPTPGQPSGYYGPIGTYPSGPLPRPLNEKIISHQQPQQQQQHLNMQQAPQVTQPQPQQPTHQPSQQQPQTTQVQVSEAKKASPQFNKAFGYVKKIKNRFANDPETYKAFLAALHSYHKEQLTIHEVYEQVSLLFRDNPDLLAEFMQFLPEQDAAAIINRTSAGGHGHGPALGRFGDIELRSKRAASVASKAVKRARQATALLSQYPSTAGYVASHRSPEETEFFEKVKAYLANRSVYAEFLKCLSLFSQDILKLDDLLRLVNGFIGGSEELYGWFKRYIGLKESQTTAVAAAETSSNWKGTAAGITSEIPELNLASCKRIGSYRVYPKNHKLVKASGRTALCEEVLNDAMISCPSFTSEDSTFVGSKKNQYEEALFKCEDERYELDLLIEYNLATIAVFEPLMRRIESMELEERGNLTLGSTLGGTSQVIYRKAIRRIYGDKSEEIINAVKQTPVTAVPIVLARLKQKDEEWRKLQRDWNKIWRDVHLRNHYKALDHQGIEFKNFDKRNFNVKTLVSELESIRDESRVLKERHPEKEAVSSLEFTISHPDRLLDDLVRLIKVYLRSTSGLSSTDRKAILEFMSTFVPEFFAWKRSTDFADGLVPSKSRDEMSVDTEDSGAEDEIAELPLSGLTPANDSNSSRLLFANTSLFAFMRLLEMALERLDKLFTISQRSAPSASKEKRNVVAAFLDLQTREKFPDLGNDDYRSLMVLLKRFLYGDLEPAAFEEQARFMFGNDAYSVYTFDKLLQAIVKQAQTVLVDSSCEHLIRLFDSCRGSSQQQQKLSEYSLRLAAENLIASNARDALFRVEWVPRTGRLTFQILDRLFAAQGGSVEARWSAYVDGFVKLDTNPDYLDPKSHVFLKRCLRAKNNSMDDDDLFVDYNLECKICINTYKLFYVEHTEDFLYRQRRRSSPRPDDSNKFRRFARWWRQEWEVIGEGPIEAATEAFRSQFHLSLHDNDTHNAL